MSSSEEEADGGTTLLSDGPADEDTLRIMISTDNHLGYNEADPVRGLDSFAAFEEVLYLSKLYQCDMVLIAGDLFHHNRPTRHTLHKAMDILRRYVFGPNPVQIQILSDPTTTLSRSQNIVNYLSEFHSVDLPIFSIHGNHDDPSRDSGGELLAALDLLSVTSLVNYFGRQDQVDQVVVKPILLSKGSTKLALYGLGSHREERLNRMFNAKKVKFQRPEEDEENGGNDNSDNEDGENEFLNIFCLHQNRDLGRGAKNCVQERMIPEWLDIVIWGHEHECNIDLHESLVGTFRITQPGSSVATSLVAGEAVRKKVGILDVKGASYRMTPVPLTQVRSFVTTEISLKESKEELDPDDAKIEEKVSEVLQDEVNIMILNAREKMKEVFDEAKTVGNNSADEDSPLRYKLVQPEKVLVRVRVEHSGFTTLNPQRFGNKFVGDVANPHELLLFHRRKETAARGKSAKKRSLDNPVVPEEMDENDNGRARLEGLLQEHLEQDKQLKLLEANDMRESLEEYVEKGGNNVIVEAVAGGLETKQDFLISGGAKTQEGDAIDKPSQVRNFYTESSSQMDEKEKSSKKKKASARAKGSKRAKPQDDSDDSAEDTGGKENLMDLDDDDDDEVEEVPKRSVSRKPSSKVARTAPKDPKRMAARRNRLNDVADNLSDSSEEAPKAKKARSKAVASRPKRSKARSVNYSVDDDDGGDDSDAVIDLSQEDDDEVLVVDEPVKKPKARSKANTGRKKPASKSSRKASRNASRLDDSDDDFDGMGYGTGTADINDDWGSAPTRSQL